MNGDGLTMFQLGVLMEADLIVTRARAEWTRQHDLHRGAHDHPTAGCWICEGDTPD